MFKVAKIVCLLFLTMLAQGKAFADDSPPLYGNYMFGTAKADIAELPSLTACPEFSPDGALCQKGERFAGQNWIKVFAFLDDKLVSVHLVSLDDALPHYIAAMKAIRSKNVINVSIQNAAKQELDLFALLKLSTDIDVVTKAMDAFGVEALASGYVSFLFYNAEALSPEAAQAADSRMNFLLSAPDSIRGCTVSLDMRGPTVCDIEFSAPKRLLKLAVEQLSSS